jgi:hypothetical protein
LFDADVVAIRERGWERFKVNQVLLVTLNISTIEYNIELLEPPPINTSSPNDDAAG